MTDTNDVSFMEMAIAEAAEDARSGEGGPFGAVIMKDGKVIATGRNQVTSSKDITAHAEMIAIRNACKNLDSKDLSECVLYSSCYPCPMCMGACVWAKFKAIYYAASADEAEKEGFSSKFVYNFISNPKTDESRILERMTVPEHLKPFAEWEKNRERRDTERIEYKFKNYS